ncbi:MAG TPA: hypothetical protein VIT45_04990 [Allosphingosinicella sp.]
MDFAAEQEIRARAGNLALAWYEEKHGPFRGAEPEAYRDMVTASHVATEESRLALHRWIEASRRAGFSWAEIGALIGISKQAAQQRFGGSEPAAEPRAADLIIRHGATAANEMAMLREEGRAGRELVDTGVLKLYLRQTGRRWEYERITGLFPDSVKRQMERRGWTWVSTWYPFHYFKRDSGPLE